MFKRNEKERSDRALAEKARQYLSAWELYRGTVTVLAVLPSGLVVSGGGKYDGTIKCWQVDDKTGKAQCLSTWEGHRDGVNALAVLDNGFVLSGYGDGTIKCWQVDDKTGKAQCLSTWEGIYGSVYALAVLPNGFVVSGDGEETVNCWQVDDKTGEATHLSLFGYHDSVVYALAVLDNGFVLSGSRDNTIKCWQVDDKTGKAQCLSTWEGSKGSVYALAVLDNGFVVSGGGEYKKPGEIKCWKVEGKTGRAQCLSAWEGHEKYVAALAVLDNGFVLSGDGDGTIKCWQVDDKTGEAQCLSIWGMSSAISYNYAITLAVLDNGFVVSGLGYQGMICWQGVSFSDVLQQAEQGGATAQYRLGLAYAKGRAEEGIEQDIGQAVKWWQLAAWQGLQKAVRQLYRYALQGEQHACVALQVLASEGNAFAQYHLGQLCYQGKSVNQDIGAALKWMKLSADAGYAPAKQQLQRWQESVLSLEGISSAQDSLWQRLKAQRRVKKKESVVEENKAEVGLAMSELLIASDSESVVVAEITVEDDLPPVFSSDANQLQATLSAHQLTCLLGGQYAELIECIKALGIEEADTLLQVDMHSAALAELYALVRTYPVGDVKASGALMQVLGRCVPVYQLVGDNDDVEEVLPRLEEAALLVQQAIEVVGRAHWLLRHQALGQLQVIAREYAAVNAVMQQRGEQGLLVYQGRASAAVLGEGYYHLPVVVARQLLCIDEAGKEVKANQAGSHAVMALDGVHYKPNSKTEFPINPGKEYAVSSLIQLIAGQSLAAAPSTLLSVGAVPIQDEEDPVAMTGNLVQGGLTITGMCFKDFIECREALGVWQSRLSAEAMVTLLQDVREGFAHVLAVAQQRCPAVFGVFDLSIEADRAALSEGLRHAFETVCAGKAVEAQLCDVADSAGRPEANRRNTFRGLFESFLSAGGTVDALRALLGVVCQYPGLMVRQEIAGLLQQCKHTKRIFTLLPNTPLETALTIVPQLLTERYLDTEAMSALWLGLLLTLPCDGKFDNFMLQLDFDADKQLQRCRIVAIDNDMSLKMPFRVNKHGQLSLELKNLLLVLPELMALPIHPTVRKHCLSLSADGWYLTWLSLLAKRDSDYQQWLAQGTVSEKVLRAIDIPVQLPRQVWQFIKTQWRLLHDIVQSNADVTLGQCFAQLYPLMDSAYQGLNQLDSPLSGPLAAEFNLYRFFKMGGNCPVEQLLEEWPAELEQGQCAEEASPTVSASAQAVSEVRQLDWALIPVHEQWPVVEALSLLPGLTLQDWQGVTEEAIRPRVQGWFREAVTRGRPFVAQRLLDLGAQVSLPDESENTALHQLCASYLNYPDSETIRLMSYVLLGHHSCQPNQYNASGYTPLLQWVNVTPEPERLTPTQSDSALRLLEALIAYGANLEAKDGFKHETALDKTMKQGREKWHWFEVLIDKGAGVHANGKMIVKRVHESEALAQRATLQAALKRLAKTNLSVAWGLSQEVWQPASGEQSKSAVVVHGSHCGHVVLPQPIAENLLTDKRVFDVKGQSTDYGRRVVKAIQYNQANWHVKENPEMPGVEMAVGALSRLLFGEHTAPNEVFSFFDAKGAAYPVLISQTVAGENLQTVLNQPKAKSQAALRQLHPQYTCEQIVLAMLVHPEDGKPDNYQLLPVTTTQADGQSVAQYRIVGIDNDHAFVKPVEMKKGHRTLQVKSVLFCLDTMRQPVHPAVRQRLLHLDPVAFLESWLEQLMAYHERSMSLFDKKARQRLFKAKMDLKQVARKVALREVYERLPVVVTVPFRDGAITELWDRLVRLQQVLRDNPMITHLQLLKEITPALGIVYEEAFEVHEAPEEVAKRFHEVAQAYYSTAIAGRYATLTTSRQALEAAGFSDKEQEAMVKGDKDTSFTPQRALFQLRQGVEQRGALATYVDMLAKGDTLVFEQILSEQVKEEVVNRLDFGQMAKQPDIVKQKAILKLIITEQMAFHTLTIRHCAALTDELLAALLKNTPELGRLTLVDCPQVTDKLGGMLERYTPHLTTLTLRQLPNLAGLANRVVTGLVNQVVSYDPINLPHLRRVNVSDNLQLRAIAIQSRALMLATCKHNPVLTELTLFCEALNALDVSECQQLGNDGLKNVLQSCRQVNQLNLSGCQQLTNRGLQNALQTYPALPKLTIDNCRNVGAQLWWCMDYIGQQAVSVFPQWNMKTWQSPVLLSLLPYASDRVVQIDSDAIEPNQLDVVMGLVASNLDVHTVLINLSSEHIATSLSPLLRLLQSNHSIMALCITGASLNHVMAEHMTTTVARCAAIRILALTVDNSQAAIAQLQQATQLSQVMLNGVNVTSQLKASRAANSSAIANELKGQQAMMVDVLALSMQHESAAIRQSVANTLALLSASGKLDECKQRVTELLSGENPTLLTVQHAESSADLSSSSNSDKGGSKQLIGELDNEQKLSPYSSSPPLAALINQFSGIAQQKKRTKLPSSNCSSSSSSSESSAQQLSATVSEVKAALYYLDQLCENKKIEGRQFTNWYLARNDDGIEVDALSEQRITEDLGGELYNTILEKISELDNEQKFSVSKPVPRVP